MNISRKFEQKKLKQVYNVVFNVSEVKIQTEQIHDNKNENNA